MVYAATVWPKPCLPFAYVFSLLHHLSHFVVQNLTECFSYGFLVVLSLDSSPGQPCLLPWISLLLLLLSTSSVRTRFSISNYTRSPMVSTPSPPYLIHTFTIWSAPAAFLFLSLATHIFPSLVNPVCTPSEPLSPLSGASTSRLCPPVDGVCQTDTATFRVAYLRNVFLAITSTITGSMLLYTGNC